MTKVIEPEKDAVNAGYQPSGEAANPSIWEVIDDIMCDVPAEVLRQLPTDGAEQHDHYLYGAPKSAPQEW